MHYEGRNEKGESKRRIVPKYEKWNYADTEELAQIKLGQIHEEAFDKDIDKRFTPYSRKLIPCIKELRRALFPGGDRSLYGWVKTILREARESVTHES